MILTNLQAKKILENPPHKENLKQVRLHESKLRVFTEELDEKEIEKEPYWTLFKKTVENRIKGKFNRVCDFIRFTLPVVEITDSVLGDFYRVFEGKNKFFNIEGDRDLTRLQNWIDEKNLQTWIEDQAKQIFKNKPASFVIIDRGSDGNPVCILIDSDRLVDAQFKKGQKGDLEYIAFVHSVMRSEDGKTVTRYAVYDDENYHVFIKDDAGAFIHDEEMSSTHDIGYCPASAFIKEINNSKNDYKRRTAFGSSVSKLEDWTVFDIFRNYVDHYAPFPVTESIVSKCGNSECEDGVVKVEETILEGPKKGQQRIKKTKCQICDGQGKGKALIGPGTHIGIKHQPNAQLDDGSGKFRMIFPETDKLKYTPEKLDALELEIRYKTVGVNNMLTKEAINEVQAKGSFQSMETVLLRNKTVLDRIYVFIVTTAGRMLYKNLVINVDADYGTEWYLMSEEDLQKRFDNAKKIGLPINEMVSIYKQIIETKYSNNKSKRDRELMLIDIQDYPFNSLDEMVKLKNESVVDDFQLSLNANFYNFVNRFERENGRINLFGLGIDYVKRIETIKETLELYNLELIAKKTIRNSPEDADGEVQVTQEQLDAQANLRGTVGGVQGIIAIQTSINQGVTSKESGIATMVEIYGFNEKKAAEILGVNSINNNQNQ